jgi:YVTN family beta-propeller protein
VPNPVFLTYDSANGNIYAANHDTQVVSVIDSSTNNVINTITVGSDPSGVGYNLALHISLLETLFSDIIILDLSEAR